MTCAAWKQKCSPWQLARLGISGEICQFSVNTEAVSASPGAWKPSHECRSCLACCTVPASSKTPPALKLPRWISVRVLSSRLPEQETAWSQGRRFGWCPETPEQIPRQGQDRLISVIFCHSESKKWILVLIKMCCLTGKPEISSF